MRRLDRLISQGASRVAPSLRSTLAYLGSRWRLWWVAAAINILLLFAFLWSRPGSTTTLRIEAIGSEFQAYIDGKLTAQASYDGFPRGGIGLVLPREDAIPSLPGPSKLKSVKVTDRDGSAILFEDSFDGEEDGPWVVSGGEWVRRGGAYWSPGGGTVTTGSQPWRDYVLDASFSNLTQVQFLVRVQDNGDAVFFSFRPFRDFDSTFFTRRNGVYAEAIGGHRVQVSQLETIRSMVAMTLHPYPTIGLLAIGAILVIVVSGLVGQDRRLASFGQRLTGRLVGPTVWAAVAAAFAILLYINYVVFDHMPHIPDEVAYLFQARILASFRIFAEAPNLGEHFAYGSAIQYADRWFSQYPFGHPLALAVGIRLGVPWLIPPVLGGVSVFLVYQVGKHIYGAGTGLLAAVLLLFSPFFQMTGSNFMSHNTAAVYLTAGTLFFARPGRRPVLSWFLSGVFLGLLFNTRPLTAAGVLVPFGLWLAYGLWRAQDRRAYFRQILALAGGFGLLLALYFLYNLVLTGSLTKTPYNLGGGVNNETVGFSGRHTVAGGLMNSQTDLALLVLVLNGWPLAIGLLLPLLPFILGSRNRWDYFFLAQIFFIAVAWTAFEGPHIGHGGPRLWYEMVPFLMLLSARGVQCLITFVGDASSWLGERMEFPRGLESRATATIAVSALVVALLAFSVNGWMLGRHDGWPPIDFVPRKISELENFNSANDGLLKQVEDQDLHEALVLVRECAHWWCYGTVFWKNSPHLDGDIIYARDLGAEKNAALIAEFPGRSVYLADYDQKSVEPYRVSAQAPSPTVPAPSPTPTDSPAELSERDSERQRDLKRVADAFGEYRARFGSYPSTGGSVQSLCTYPHDAGCEVLEVMAAIPRDPQDYSYWYASDGERFSLFAIQEGGADPNLSSCPFYASSLDPRVGYCLSGPP